MKKEKIFDFIYYANNPEAWEKQKNKMQMSISELNKQKKYVIEQIRTNFKNFSLGGMINNLKRGLSFNINDNRTDTYNFQLDFSNHITTIVIKKKSDLIKIKNYFPELLSEISYSIGRYESNIIHTDLFIMKVQGKSMNENFLHITNIPFLSGIDIKYIPYFSEYERIKLDGIYSDEEKIYLAETFSIFKITWKSAFYILHYRYKNNNHFLKIFVNEKNYIDYETYLNVCFELFNGSYKKLIKKRGIRSLK